MGLYKKGKSWYIDYYVLGKRKRERIGPGKKLAESVLNKRRTQIAENKFLDIKRTEKIKFDEFANLYLELHSKPNKKSWKKSDVNNLKNLCPFFGNRSLSEITPIMVEKYKIARAQNVSPATVNRELACLKHMFNKAIEWNKADANPVRKVKLFKENNKRLRYLEKEEIKKLLDACGGHLKPIVILALNTGMRKGEILGLKWQDVDIKRGIIYLLDTKNNEKREIPINEFLAKTLIAVRKHPDSPYIFCNKDGKSYANVRKSFYTALKKSGIINFRFHDLRHTFASQLVMAGIDLNTVRELLGHKTIEMTLRYAHLSPDHKQKAVEILGRQMDTFWTPKAETGIFKKSEFPEHIDNKEVEDKGPIAQLVRAADS